MKLLQKTIRSYLVYSVVILLIAIPVFYLVIQQIVKEDTDEHLLAAKAMLKPVISKAILNHTIGQLTFADQDTRFTKSVYTRSFDSLINKEAFDSISGEMVPYRVLLSNFLVSGEPWLLQVRYSMVDNEDLIESIVKVQVLLLIILLAGLLLINRNLSQRIWSPFNDTLEKLDHYKVEQRQPLALITSSINEFDRLNRSLRELTDRAHKTYLTQKEFTENASHEMQTPLAIFQGKLELLMQTSPLDQEQAELIGDLADASQRLRRLNKSLLLLTRIENLQFAETETLSLNAILEKFIGEFEPQLREKQLTLSPDLRNMEFLVANTSLVEILVGNLLGNAIRHNFEGGLILIGLADHQLTIQNTGPDKALDDEQIFRRFHKESADPNSLGLGLQIVKQVCHFYGWTISYAHDAGLHSFTVNFINR